MKITKDALILAQALGGGGGITPTGNQDITTLNEYDVTDKATARVSAAERAKIIPENIKSGETILGVEGTYSGGGASVAPNDVNFYDYDGTIVASYSAADFANLSTMPANPTHAGLTAQGWNWSLADAKTYVASYGMLDIGQMYITDDGKTRLYISIPTTGRMSPTLHISQTVANGVTIDWGDGSATETVAGMGGISITHTYSAVGDYVITLNPAEGCNVGLGYTSDALFTPRVYYNIVKKVEIGSRANIGSNAALSNYSSMKSITMPDSITSNSSTSMGGCNSLKFVILPNNLNAGVDFGECRALVTVAYRTNATQMPDMAFYNCFALSSITLPKDLTSIPRLAFYACYSLARISIPSAVTSIGVNAFNNCTGMAIYDFSACTTVPTLSATNAFTGIPSDCKILVPASLYDTWKAASNWSNYASQIIAV